MIDQVLRRLFGDALVEHHGQKLRYLFVGGLNTADGLAAFPVLYYLLSGAALGYLTVLSISQIICICFAYLTNKFLVFKTAGNYVGEYLQFITFHLVYFVVNVFFLKFSVERLGFSPVLSQLIFALLVIVSSYLWHSKITFSQVKR